MRTPPCYSHQYICVCVWVFRSVCGCVSVCVSYSLAQMVGILLCLYKATIIESQTLELNHKSWEILLLTWCLTQSCPVLCAMFSDLGNRHVRSFEILRTFSTGSMQPPASTSQPPQIPPKIFFILPWALKIGAAYLIWSLRPILTII